MPPRLVSDDGKNIVTRPIACVLDKDPICWAAAQNFPLVACTRCGSQENLQRKPVGNMLRDWDKNFPGRLQSVWSALQHIVPSHLMGRAPHDFKTICTTGMLGPHGDTAFEEETFVGAQTLAPVGVAATSGVPASAVIAFKPPR